MDLGKVTHSIGDAARHAAQAAKHAAQEGVHWIQEHTVDAMHVHELWVPVNHLDRFVMGQGRDWAMQGYDAFVIHFQAEHVQWVIDDDAVIVEASLGAKRSVIDEMQGTRSPNGYEWMYEGHERWARAGRMVMKLCTEAFYSPSGEVKVTAYPPE